jgi:hypothetical protein
MSIPLVFSKSFSAVRIAQVIIVRTGGIWPTTIPSQNLQFYGQTKLSRL